MDQGRIQGEGDLAGPLKLILKKKYREKKGKRPEQEMEIDEKI